TAAKQRSIGLPSCSLQLRNVCDGGERRRRLVESDVPVQAEADDLHVDAASSGDRAFVAIALGRRVCSETVEELNPRRTKGDGIEQAPPHERVKAARILRADAAEFVEIEDSGTAELGMPPRVQPRKRAEQRDGCLAGRQSENERRLVRKRACDFPRDREAGGV